MSDCTDLVPSDIDSERRETLIVSFAVSLLTYLSLDPVTEIVSRLPPNASKEEDTIHAVNIIATPIKTAGAEY
jgi:hypothetical protein